MAKTKISEFSSTPGNNTDIDSINIAEGCAPSGINDAIRELMAQLKDFQTGAVGDSFNGPVGTTTAAAGAFTTLAASGAVTLSGGTANGVPYLNGSKVLTTGSALTYNGTGLGVGVSSASFALDVGGADGTNIALRSTGTSSARLRAYVNSAESGVIGFLNGGGQFFEVAGSEQMRLTSTGLGIGTSSPTAKLDVRGNATFTGNGTSRQTADFTNTGGQLYVGAESSSGGAVFVGSSAYAGIVGTNTNTPLQLGTNGTIKATLDSSGNLGLGVTPSAWKSGAKAFQLGATGYASLNEQANGSTSLNFNCYESAANTWTYYVTGVAPTRYTQLSGTHAWYTAPSGTAGNAISFTQAMTLDASGNLGVGTTSPSTRLHVAGGSVTEVRVVSSGSLVTGSASLIRFGGSNSATSGYFGYGGSASTLDVWNSLSGAITFGTSNLERARIDSSGNLLVGTTVQPTGVTGGAGFIRLGSARSTLYTASTTTSSAGLVVFLNPNGEVGSISTSGTATTYATSSDYRLKNITGPITTSGAYIDSLNPVEGTWKADGSTFVGLIAHEVQEASRTNVATGVKDGEEMQGMDYSSAEIIANLIAEVKSLRQRLAAAGI